MGAPLDPEALGFPATPPVVPKFGALVELAGAPKVGAVVDAPAAGGGVPDSAGPVGGLAPVDGPAGFAPVAPPEGLGFVGGFPNITF